MVKNSISGWRLVLLTWFLGTAIFIVVAPRTLWVPLMADFLMAFVMFVAVFSLAASGLFMSIFWPGEYSGWWTIPVRVVLAVVGFGMLLMIIWPSAEVVLEYLAL